MVTRSGARAAAILIGIMMFVRGVIEWGLVRSAEVTAGVTLFVVLVSLWVNLRPAGSLARVVTTETRFSRATDRIAEPLRNTVAVLIGLFGIGMGIAFVFVGGWVAAIICIPGGAYLLRGGVRGFAHRS